MNCPGELNGSRQPPICLLIHARRPSTVCTRQVPFYSKSIRVVSPVFLQVGGHKTLPHTLFSLIQLCPIFSDLQPEILPALNFSYRTPSVLKHSTCFVRNSSSAAMASSLYSYQSWLNFYETKASVFPYTTKTNPNLLRTELLTISQVALDRRAYELRDSDSYLNKKLKTAAAGIIPGLKSIVSINQSEKFADEALRAFGLSDVAGLETVARNLKRSTNGRQDLAMDVLKGLAETLGKVELDQLLTETGIHAASETVHLKPGIGQAISAGIGYTMTRKRLLSIIEKARATAGEVHRDLLIPIVVQRVL